MRDLYSSGINVLVQIPVAVLTTQWCWSLFDPAPHTAILILHTPVLVVWKYSTVNMVVLMFQETL